MEHLVAAVVAEGERSIARVRELAVASTVAGRELREGAWRTRRGAGVDWSARAALAYAAEREALVDATVAAARGCDEVAAALRRHAATCEQRLDELRGLAARVEVARDEAAAAGARARRLATSAADEASAEVGELVDRGREVALGAARAAVREADRAVDVLGRRLREDLPRWAPAG